MNYALATSNRVEDKLEHISRHNAWSSKDEKVAYTQCLEAVLAEEHCNATAEGNIRVGDYILLGMVSRSRDVMLY